ncbi:thioredoxin family protein [Nocardioides sp. SOB44]|uniref:Thioredoxin family protein n=1 Tax=Nocardioides cremeus TaxID=3058044 RepID=A0ABT8TSQ3_9ACTN|nr:thioredoxin family protein [Nocardioides cremeus]MDO3396866.1 thioredoxin family protein [Nocardioides cremeus]
MPTGLWIALAAVVIALAFGAYRALTDGRFRGTHEVRGAAGGAGAAAAEPAVAERTVWDDVVAAVPDAQLGERATFVQFSSAFCAPCRATRRTLSEVVELVPGVVHLEVDAEHHLDLVRRLDVLRTPTTLVLDASGREATRAAGAPRKETVLATLGSVVGD